MENSEVIDVDTVIKNPQQSMKNILFIFSGFGIGGLEIRACHIMNHFKRTYRFTICSMNGDYGATVLLDKSLNYSCTTLKKTTNNSLKSVFLFQKELKRIKPDLIMTYNWGTIEWVMSNRLFCNIPNIHSEEGFHSDEIKGQKGRRVFIRWLFLSRVDKVLVPSDCLRNIALHKWRLPKSKISYITNGIDCDKFNGKAKKNIDDSPVVIGTVAGLRRVKNLELLIRVYSMLNTKFKTELWIIGDGTEKDSLKTYVKKIECSSSIKFLGYHKDPSPFLKDIDIYAISSITEQMPISLLEAMASGCAVVSTDVGDIKSMVCEENQRMVVDSEDQDQYFKCLMELVNNDELRSVLADKNRKKCVKAFSNKEMFLSYKNLFKQTIK